MPPTKTPKNTPSNPERPVKSQHPTREKLLNTVVELLKEHLPNAITSEMVLKASGISRGSLYHHFADFSELIEVALVDSFTRSVDRSVLALIDVVTTSKKKSDVYNGLVNVTYGTQSASLKQVRFKRARLLALSEDNPRLRQALATEQQRLTDAMTDLFREAQMRGWMNTEFDPRAGAVMIQAYTLGKIVDDIVPEPMDQDAWNKLIIRIVEKVFF